MVRKNPGPQCSPSWSWAFAKEKKLPLLAEAEEGSCLGLRFRDKLLLCCFHGNVSRTFRCCHRQVEEDKLFLKWRLGCCGKATNVARGKDSWKSSRSQTQNLPSVFLVPVKEASGRSRTPGAQRGWGLVECVEMKHPSLSGAVVQSVVEKLSLLLVAKSHRTANECLQSNRLKRCEH